VVESFVCFVIPAEDVHCRGPVKFQHDQANEQFDRKGSPINDIAWAKMPERERGHGVGEVRQRKEGHSHVPAY